MSVLPITLLHGWGLNAAVWTGVVEGLSSQVRAPDLPGHGAAVAACPLDFEALVAEVAAPLPDGGIVVGWSFGGLLTLGIAAWHPQKISRMALISTNPCFVQAPGWQAGVSAESWTGFAERLAADYEHSLSRFLALQVGAGDRQALRALKQALVARGRPQISALERTLAMMCGTDARCWVPGLSQPTLVVYGTHDRVVPPAAGAWLASHLPCATSSVLVGAGHVPFLSDPVRFRALLEAFVHAP